MWCRINEKVSREPNLNILALGFFAVGQFAVRTVRRKK